MLFIESICDDPVILERNYAMKLGNADYRGRDPAEARADFLARVAKYEKVYEPVVEDALSYVKIFNVGQKVRGFLLCVSVCVPGMRVCSCVFLVCVCVPCFEHWRPVNACVLLCAGGDEPVQWVPGVPNHLLLV